MSSSSQQRELVFPEIRAGNLGVKISRDPQEVEEAQRLRYQIFFGEMGGVSHNPEVVSQQRDFDAFDAVCDHLLVVDHDKKRGEGRVVGTYRLLRREPMKALGRFYTESEFNIEALKALQGDILELGRSCVHADYRNRAVMQLLWRGIGEYVSRNNIRIMFGCASFVGTDPEEYAEALSYLYHFHLAPEDRRPVAQPDHFVPMNRMPKDAIDEKRALAQLPALIKGYLRLNGKIGDGCYIDTECRSLDVSIVVETDLVTEKYVKRYNTDGRTSGDGRD